MKSCSACPARARPVRRRWGAGGGPARRDAPHRRRAAGTPSGDRDQAVTIADPSATVRAGAIAAAPLRGLPSDHVVGMGLSP